MSKILNRDVFYYPNLVFENKHLINISNTSAKDLFAFIYNIADDDGVAVFTFKDMKFAFKHRKVFNNCFNILVEANIIEDRRQPTDHIEDITVFIKPIKLWGRKLEEVKINEQNNNIQLEAEVYFDPKKRELMRQADAQSIKDKYKTEEYVYGPLSDLDTIEKERKILTEMFTAGALDGFGLTDAIKVAEKIQDGKYVKPHELTQAIHDAIEPKLMIADPTVMKAMLTKRVKKTCKHFTIEEVDLVVNKLLRDGPANFKLTIDEVKDKSIARQSKQKLKDQENGKELSAPKPIKGYSQKKAEMNWSKENNETPDEKPTSFIKPLTDEPVSSTPRYKTEDELAQTSTPASIPVKEELPIIIIKPTNNKSPYDPNKSYPILEFPWYSIKMVGDKEKFLKYKDWEPRKGDYVNALSMLSTMAETALNTLEQRGRINLKRKYGTDTYSLAKLYTIFHFFRLIANNLPDDEIEFFIKNFDVYDWWSDSPTTYPNHKYDPYTDPTLEEEE